MLSRWRVVSLYNRYFVAGYSSNSYTTCLMKQIDEAATALKELGRRLREARLERNDSMAIFAERLGVSERTVRALEQGRPTVQVGIWLNALWALDALEALDRVLAPQESLLDRARNMHKARRQRASRLRGL
jgi:hypothetical protein